MLQTTASFSSGKPAFTIIERMKRLGQMNMSVERTSLRRFHFRASSNASILAAAEPFMQRCCHTAFGLSIHSEHGCPSRRQRYEGQNSL